VFDEHKRQSGMTKNKTGIVSKELVNKALKIAFSAHNGQTDKAGQPYMLHPLHIAEQMKGEIAVCAALLHDVVEDSDMTFDMLAGDGIPDEVISILKLLTHDPSIPYMEGL
jgi:(p)ppGpp synthase/HD superfamily hydrolase